MKIQVGVGPVFEHIFGITGIQKNRELILQFLMQLPGWGFSKILLVESILFKIILHLRLHFTGPMRVDLVRISGIEDILCL